jgi:hypothetical protein
MIRCDKSGRVESRMYRGREDSLTADQEKNCLLPTYRNALESCAQSKGRIARKVKKTKKMAGVSGCSASDRLKWSPCHVGEHDTAVRTGSLSRW